MAKQGSILIVDDNKAILSAVKLLVDKYFEKVLTLSSPNSLVSTMRTERPDVVLLDMNFNAGINTGNEGIYWLQQILDRYPSTKVVLFTAYADDGTNTNAKGVYGHFYFDGNYMDATCSKLSDKQRTAMAKVNADNTAGLILKNDFASKDDVLAKTAFDIAEHTSLQPTAEAYHHGRDEQVGEEHKQPKAHGGLLSLSAGASEDPAVVPELSIEHEAEPQDDPQQGDPVPGLHGPRQLQKTGEQEPSAYGSAAGAHAPAVGRPVLRRHLSPVVPMDAGEVSPQIQDAHEDQQQSQYDHRNPFRHTDPLRKYGCHDFITNTGRCPRGLLVDGRREVCYTKLISLSKRGRLGPEGRRVAWDRTTISVRAVWPGISSAWRCP